MQSQLKRHNFKCSGNLNNNNFKEEYYDFEIKKEDWGEHEESIEDNQNSIQSSEKDLFEDLVYDENQNTYFENILNSSNYFPLYSFILQIPNSIYIVHNKYIFYLI